MSANMTSTCLSTPGKGLGLPGSYRRGKGEVETILDDFYLSKIGVLLLFVNSICFLFCLFVGFGFLRQRLMQLRGRPQTLHVAKDNLEILILLPPPLKC